MSTTSNKNLILSTLKPGSFFKANKAIARGFKSNNTAIVLAELIFKYDYFDTREELVNGECFYCTKDNLRASCNVGEKELTKCIGNLVRAGIISKEVMGLPAKTHYMINFDILADFMAKTALQPNNGDSTLPGEGTRTLLGEGTGTLLKEGTNKKEVSKKKKGKRKLLTPRTPSQIIIEEKARQKSGGNDKDKSYEEELAILIDSDVDDRITALLDMANPYDEESMDITHKALAQIADLPTHFTMSRQDVHLMEKVIEADNSSLVLTYKLLENIAKIKSGEKKQRFGQIFFGTNELMDNKEAI